MRIIYIDLDSVRPDHLGCYGYKRPTTPNIDRIATNAVRFDRYYCASSPCLPSRTALLSGRLGINNGVISNVSEGAKFHIRTGDYTGPWRANEVLPRHLRRHGMDAICISNFADRHSCWYWMCGFTEFITPNLKAGHETAEEVNDVVLSWLERNADRDHYYLHINYWDMHRPYKMDPSWADRFADMPVSQSWPDAAAIETMKDYTGLFTSKNQWRHQEGKSPFPLMPDNVDSYADFQKMVTGYDAAIAYTDHYLGQVFELLEKQGILDDTAIIITGDHGDAFGEHGIYSDHVCADECIHRVPLIVHWPGLTNGMRTDDRLLTNVDLAPTLCDMLGMPVCEWWDGQSFAPAIRNEDDGPDRNYIVWDHGLYTVQRAVRTKQHLMIKTYDQLDYQQFEPTALYDMDADPYQSTNIAGTHPDIVAECEAYLAAWLDEQRVKPSHVSDPLDAIVAERRHKQG